MAAPLRCLSAETSQPRCRSGHPPAIGRLTDRRERTHTRGPEPKFAFHLTLRDGLSAPARRSPPPLGALVSVGWLAWKTCPNDRYVTPLLHRACRGPRRAEAGPGRSAGLLFQGGQELPAGLLAAPAGLLADPAVLVHLGVPLALVAAALADGHAGLQQPPGDARVVGRLAACHPDRGA